MQSDLFFARRASIADKPPETEQTVDAGEEEFARFRPRSRRPAERSVSLELNARDGRRNRSLKPMASYEVASVPSAIAWTSHQNGKGDGEKEGSPSSAGRFPGRVSDSLRHSLFRHRFPLFAASRPGPKLVHFGSDADFGATADKKSVFRRPTSGQIRGRI